MQARPERMPEREHDDRAQEQEHRRDEQQSGAPAPAVERPMPAAEGAGLAVVRATSATSGARVECSSSPRRRGPSVSRPIGKDERHWIPACAGMTALRYPAASSSAARRDRGRSRRSCPAASSAFCTASTMSFAAMSAQTGRRQRIAARVRADLHELREHRIRLDLRIVRRGRCASASSSRPWRAATDHLRSASNLMNFHAASGCAHECEIDDAVIVDSVGAFGTFAGFGATNILPFIAGLSPTTFATAQ